MLKLDSSAEFDLSSLYSTGGTSICKSSRSSIGPDIRLRYFLTAFAEQVHFLVGWPKKPQGQGFIAATRVNELGYVSEPATREIVTFPSSKGWRRASITSLLNSGSSSKNKTPLCASDISPGLGTVPPPDMAREDTV